MDSGQRQFQGKFRVDVRRSKEAGQESPRSILAKRHRSQLSCTPCRRRKARCDRSQPCLNCVNTGEAEACSYKGHVAKQNNRAAVLAQKIDHMESLIQLTVGSTTLGNVAIDEAGPQSYTDGHYAGSTHWEALMQSIFDLRSEVHLNELDETDSEDADSGHIKEKSDIIPGHRLFSTASPLPLPYILRSALPDRRTADRRVALYLNTKHLVFPCVHVPQFQRMYNRFWEDPTSVPIMWISMLFSCLCLSTQVGNIMSGTKDNSEARLYMVAASQVLQLGDMTTPSRFLVEALILYGQCQYSASLDPAGEVWALLGVVRQQALRMGYHRDPRHFPSMSTFQAEMRRRIWALVLQLDLLSASQMGLPPTIQYRIYDTDLPSNLLDTDFDEHTTPLPNPRPELKPTEILYFVTKARWVQVISKIIDIEFTPVNSMPATKIQELDAEIRQLRELLPECLRYKPLSESLTDSGHVIIMRIYLEIWYLKSICLLHRQDLSPPRQNPQTIRTCEDAATQMLSHQATIHEESKPGGQLFGQTLISSVAQSDFLFAAGILCMVESIEQRADADAIHAERSAARIRVLKTCLRVCSEQASGSKEAKKMSRALKTMLSKLGHPRSDTAFTISKAAFTGSDGSTLGDAGFDALSFDNDQFQYTFDTLNSEGGSDFWMSMDQTSLNSNPDSTRWDAWQEWHHDSMSYDQVP